MTDGLFTPEEANAALSDLRERLPRIRESRRQLVGFVERLSGRVAHNGGGAAGREYWEALTTLREDVERLAELGVLLRDPESGLVDFPAERDGGPVFLCWKLGEGDIAYWHDTEHGFSGRRPL